MPTISSTTTNQYRVQQQVLRRLGAEAETRTGKATQALGELKSLRNVLLLELVFTYTALEGDDLSAQVTHLNDSIRLVNDHITNLTEGLSLLPSAFSDGEVQDIDYPVPLDLIDVVSEICGIDRATLVDSIRTHGYGVGD